MLCRKCGEDNPENAVFCRNCGERLIEETKKAEVIDAAAASSQQKTGSKSISDNTEWIGCCCLGLIIVFIIAALL